MALQQLLYTFGLGTLVIWVVRSWVQYKAVSRRDEIRRIRGPTTFFPNDSDLSSVFGSSSTLTLGQLQFWLCKRRWYKTSGWDIAAALSFFPRVRITYLISDPGLVKRITSSRAEFPKSTEQYSVLRMFGRNIVTEEDEEWKKYKRICAPAFSERNNRLVWDYALRTMSEFFDDVWLADKVGNKTDVVVEDFKVPCTQFTLRILVAAAFGQLLSWKYVDTSYTSFMESSSTSPVHSLVQKPAGNSSDKLAIEEIFEIISEDLFLKLVFPEWLLRNAEWALLPFGKLRNRVIRVRKAFDGLQTYMKDIITTRNSGASSSGSSLMSSDSEKKADLFSNLIEANESDGELKDGQVWDSELGEYVSPDANSPKKQTGTSGNAKLTDAELMGNIFIFLLAGHETTAHSVCYAMALLALYPDEQEKLYQHILSVCPLDQLPRYDDLPQLTRSMAVVQEALRLFPPVIGIPKKSAEDTSFVVTNPETGEQVTIPVERGEQIVLHVPGVHYNPRYWKNPGEFSPDRFMPGSNWPRDAFVPFSAGARSCLGRRFAEIESVAIITMLTLKYRVKVKEEAKFRNETSEETKERILKSRNGITLTPLRVPLAFTRRD
ncbi:hypothetical protein VKT23_011969 [Stygiomarasmius scandens]|uniref:Cytochrome P450 n=1 Tax=Marasmiellus scandens TaxID=2682957 RepID=A0ABR1J891_9AGAR